MFHLNVSKNDITQSGLEHFAPILFQTNISELDLSLNPLGNNGVRCLSENLFENLPTERGRPPRRGAKCKLVKLNLAETKFLEHGGYHLFKNLIEFNAMQCLVLDYNLFGSENMSMLGKLIRQTSLATLSLNYCKLGDPGGQAIGDALMASSSIRDIRAKKNEFRDATAKAIATAIEDDSVVERVDLSNNLINDSGGELLGLALATNRTLSFLNLRKNNLRFTSGAMFAQSMKENKTLKCLKLQKNSINMNFLETVASFIERNNIYMLENNVAELRHNREGYLAAREEAWRDVTTRRA